MNHNEEPTVQPNNDRPWRESDVLALMPPSQWAAVAAAVELTPRECEVTRQLFAGKTRTEIAQSMQIKPRTVRHHLESIHRKLCVSNRIELVLRIVRIRDAITQEKPKICEECQQAAESDAIRLIPFDPRKRFRSSEY